MFTRRHFLVSSLAVSALVPAAARAGFEVDLSEAEWRKRLSPARFAVLREEATERAFSNSLMGERSPLLKEARKGNYLCAGCGNPVYASATKFDSGTGWPSFWDALPGGIGTRPDPGLLGNRTEVHCRRCGGHLGHVFDDGPAPTGKRHCINGLAMTFSPA
jgi:peptide-methionine (R)-S-oxide reductase